MANNKPHKKPYNVKPRPLPPGCSAEQPEILPEGSVKLPLTRGYFAIIDSDMLDKLSNHLWQLIPNHRTCYAGRIDTSTGKRVSVKVHREVLGIPPGVKQYVDHINGNGLDNRRANLRVISHAENIKAQRPRQVKPDSVYIGVVYRVSEAKKWLARIHVNGKYQKIGYFNKEEDAAKAYDKEAKRIFGDNAELNFYPETKQS